MANDSSVRGKLTFDFNNTKIKNNKKLTDEIFNRIKEYVENMSYKTKISNVKYHDNNYNCIFNAIGKYSFDVNLRWYNEEKLKEQILPLAEGLEIIFIYDESDYNYGITIKNEIAIVKFGRKDVECGIIKYGKTYCNY